VRWSQGPRIAAEKRGTEREGGTSSCRNPAPQFPAGKATRIRNSFH
jgi:hypothetical protein